ncbi:MAG: 23S rRNA (uridine(2552)-2'-O)-methyltransferase [Gammaproteobacteria bacterium]|nr:23S rRNA (uridine(2552)-2'-O)-methyltransferase [Gammaproteobacteria bacterium]
MSKSRQQKKTSSWNDRQNRDQYVKKARAAGYRGRAVYKLEQINKKYRLANRASVIADLGSAPGSWSQYLSTVVDSSDQIVGVDLLPMEMVKNVNFVQGDFTETEVVEKILSFLNNRLLDLVLSDMAPNITGIRSTDQSRALELQEMISVFCDRALKKNGALVTKLFEGEASVVARKLFGQQFNEVQMIKPDASRSESKEVFLLARGFKRG